MIEKKIHKNLIKKIKTLSSIIILSIGLNIGLISTLIYKMLKQENTNNYINKKEDDVSLDILSNNDYLLYLSTLNYKDLLLLLSNKSQVEYGYLTRDLALSCLTAFHFFNLEKALPNISIQQRYVLLEKYNNKIILFPGLCDYHFDAIINFIKYETWPFTIQGLFNLLKTNTTPSLEQSFITTNEFQVIRNLLNIDTENILHILHEISWETFSNGLNEKDVKTFLLNCIDDNSKQAAIILLKEHQDYIIKKASNKHVKKILSLTKDCEEIKKLCEEITQTPREDIILNITNEKINEITNINKEITHIVKDGESLWKIAKLYKISINDLIKKNNLKTQCIKPKDKLIIPSKSTSKDHIHQDAK